ncbi:calmodulin-like [Vitis riparia]|uniref:calmodulin-like n=1 Tax=Vitis riparia TaxID=96939 RepID=UPI00155B3C9D|nr:calmodulin-like [Vitis riparia]
MSQKTSVAVLNESTVNDFVQDSDAFEKCVDEQFKMFDSKGNGAVSRADIRRGYGRLMALEYEKQSEEEINSLNDSIFERFDEERNGTLSREQFRRFMKEMMLAMARSFGDVPVQVALEHDSMLMKAVEHELSRG